jgi:hypothetical protein
MWTMAIEGSGADPYFWNCNETTKGKAAISLGCRGWYNSGNWQVGYGIQVSQASSHLVEDFDEIYGRSDASIVQEVGNRVIQGGGITNPSRMPAKSVAQLVQEAGRPGTIFNYRPTSDTEAAAQQAIAILLMDPAIGAAAIAQEVAGDIGSDWAGSMRRWGQSYYINGLSAQNPVFSNRIQELAKHYTGVGGAVGIGGGATFPPQSFTVTVLPLEPDKLFNSGRATAEVIGARGGGTGSSSASIPPGSVDGSCTLTGGYPSDVGPELRSKYNVVLQGFSETGRKMIYEMLTCVSKSKLPSLLQNTTTTIHNAISPTINSIGMDCASSTCNIWIPETTGAFKFILTHEFGHVIYYTNPRETMLISDFERAWANEGGLSPYSRRNDGCGNGNGSMAEDYAELVAYYYNPNAGAVTGACDANKTPPNPLYKTSKYPLHLEVGKKVL